MNFKRINYLLGWILKIEAVFMILPFIISMYYKEETGFAFLYSALLSAALGIILSFKKPENKSFYAREGFITTALGWILMSLIGSLPFYISGVIPSFVDAIFEMVAGFSTTGASIITDIELFPRGMLFWRCFSIWIGGMGVLVFILAILPLARDGQNLYLMRAESPGPSVNKLVPRLQTTAVVLYKIYIIITLAQIMLLLLGNMSFFDAVCISFSTAGTGGFSVLGDSIASYNTYIQIVITVFMLLFGTNFMIYFLILSKKFKEAFQMEEVRWYYIIYFTSAILITINLSNINGNILDNFLHSAIQSASIITTTAFTTTDFNLWPQFSKSLLIFLMIVGSCAGSTGGGLKVSRVLIYIKTVKKELAYLFHNSRISVIKMNGKKVEHEVIRSANTFLVTYLAILIISTILLSIENLDFTTTFAASIATLNNIGIGLELIGPTGNYAIFNDFSKIILMFNMLAGRLEIFPMLLIFSRGVFKK